MENRRDVVVFSAAPLPVGTEVEVELVRCRDGAQGVRVRDLATSVLYGGARLFDGGPLSSKYRLLGAPTDYRGARPPDGAKVVQTFRARVLECVVANVEQTEGYATCTSFVLEILPESAAPYR